MKKLFVIALVLIAVPAFAQQTLNYSWEDGGTILGFYGSNLCCDTNVSGPQTGSQGSTLPDYTCPGAVRWRPTTCTWPRIRTTGTPQAFLCWVVGLQEGDIVDAMFYGFDTLAGREPLAEDLGQLHRDRWRHQQLLRQRRRQRCLYGR
ncbi:MAG: hypothetical protein KAJ04_02975 [Candidatus Eisenbacteria sp.]|nr:hypothetical protein [Candidatus Eisenbacteria bacterium]